VLKIPAPLFIRTGKLVLPAENIASQHNLQVMALEKPDGRVHLFESDAPCRGDNGDLIALLQISWPDHAPKVSKKAETSSGIMVSMAE